MHFSSLAYFDPGSGSYLWQLAVAALLGIGLALRSSWGSIKARLGIKPKPRSDDSEVSSEDDDTSTDD